MIGADGTSKVIHSCLHTVRTKIQHVSKAAGSDLTPNRKPFCLHEVMTEQLPPAVTEPMMVKPPPTPTSPLNSHHMSIRWLKDQDFEGFIRFDAIPDEELPREHGVYAVVRENTQEPRFVASGTGRKGSNYTMDVLQDAWLPGAVILYFGRAECKLGIYEWLNKYRRFGNGRQSGHSGGRAIWQLEDAQDLKVCWLVTGDHDPAQAESALIDLFKRNHGDHRPFANRIDGKKNRI